MRALVLAAIWICLATHVGADDRVLVHLDFEEAQVRPLDLPLAFTEIGGEGTAFPRFGRMGLSEETAHSGRFSFRFDLNGRSMAARSLPGTIPILPRVDHRIEVMVQTRDLKQAGVRLVAWLLDDSQTELAETRVVSEILEETPASFGRWRMLELLVPGTHPAASELMVELQLLQPSQWNPESDRSFVSRPLREGIAGTVFFDDLRVSAHPRVFFADATRIGLHEPGRVRLHLRIDDPGKTNAQWTLVVTDHQGTEVLSRSGQLADDGLDQTLEVPVVTPGWYEARVTLADQGTPLREAQLAFAITPRQPHHAPEPRLRVTLSPPGPRSEDGLLATDLVGHLGVGEVIVPVWRDGAAFTETWPRIRRQVDELERLGVTPIFALEGIPQDVHRTGDATPDHVVEMIVEHPDCLDNLVESVLIAFGDRASHWRLGDAEQDPERVDRAQRLLAARLEGLVIEPRLTTTPARPARSTSRSVGHDLHGFTTRILERWCRDDSPLEIDDLWRVGRHGLEPTPRYPATRTLLAALSGRTRITELPAGPRLRAVLLRGDDRPPIVIAWRTAPGVDPIELSLPLSGSDLTAWTIFGAPHPLRRGAEQIALAVPELPVILRGFDPDPVLALAGLSLDPPRIEAAIRVHDHTLTLENTTSHSWQGQLVANGTDHLRIRPSIIGVDLRPGETLIRPLEFVVTGPLSSETLSLSWDLRLRDGRRFPLTTWMPAGLTDLDIYWARRPVSRSGDLVIDLELINHGTRPRRLAARLGHRELEMPVSTSVDIAAGATETRTFRIPGGGHTLAGERLALLLEDLEGPGRLRESLRVPVRAATARVAVPGRAD